MKVIDQLDKEVFTCKKCGGNFNHIQGTWMPTGRFISDVSSKNFNIGKAISLTNIFRKPEPETEELFTCYGCLS